MPSRQYENRTLTIYFPTAKELSEIQAAARIADIPFAHFAREMIRKGMDAPPPDLSAITEATHVREELIRLRRDLRDSEVARQKLETELFTLHSSLFLQSVPEGRGQLSSELVELLQDGHVWRPTEIMEALGIDAKNIDAIKVLGGQLRSLQDLKMVEETTKGWRWVA